jgi:hypothetical protein
MGELQVNCVAGAKNQNFWCSSSNYWGYNHQQILLQVMFKIPKTGHLPSPVQLRFFCGAGCWIENPKKENHPLDPLVHKIS